MIREHSFVIAVENIVTCFVENIVWGGTDHFLSIVFQNVKITFKIVSGNIKIFSYLALNMTQNTDNSIEINQNNYINAIQPISLSRCRIKCSTESLAGNET